MGRRWGSSHEKPQASENICFFFRRKCVHGFSKEDATEENRVSLLTPMRSSGKFRV